MGWRSSKEKGSFGGKCGACRCNQWVLYGVFLCVKGGDAALPKLLCYLLLTIRLNVG